MDENLMNKLLNQDKENKMREDYEKNFDGRCSIPGANAIRGIKCKKCGKVLYAFMALEGQSKMNEIIESNGLDFLKEAYLIPCELTEIEQDGHILIKGKGLIKCADCFYVNEVNVTCAKNAKENAYKNFD